MATSVESVSAGEPRQLLIVSRQVILAMDDVQFHFPFLHERNSDCAWKREMFVE
jgi:hypothetical protein